MNAIANLSEFALESLHTATRILECKICGSPARAYDVVDFGKTCSHVTYPQGLYGVPVVYHRCEACDLVFTVFFDRFSAADWQRHVYNADYYSKVDPEYDEARPRGNVRELRSFLAGSRRSIVGLDYGGGNGKTAALMRAAGWDFTCWDPFGTRDDAGGKAGTYNFCSSFEVFEHSLSPKDSLREILSLCSKERLLVLLSTFVHDEEVSDATRLAWWYASPRNGHITFYARKTLRLLAETHGLTYSSVSKATHLLGRGYTSRDMAAMLLRGKLLARARRLLGR